MGVYFRLQKFSWKSSKIFGRMCRHFSSACPWVARASRVHLQVRRGKPPCTRLPRLRIHTLGVA
mgnify:CR=1 FL=1|jgi:hypothetical protein